MTYGFRVFVVQAFKDRVKDQPPEDVSVASAARKEVLQLLDLMWRTGTSVLEPRQPDDAATRKPATSVTTGEPHLIRDDLVHLVVSVGEHGSHRMATRAGKKPKDLKKWSPEVDHNVTLLFPKTEAHEFLVVCESVHRRDAMNAFFRVLTQFGLMEKRRAAEEEKAARKEIRASRGELPELRAHSRLLFRRRQAADNSYIDEIISSAKSATAVFQAIKPSDRGGRRPVVQRTLAIRLLENDREIGRTVGRGWTSRRKEGRRATDAQGVSELAELLTEYDLLEEDEAQHYTKAAVAVRSETGASTTIAVDTLKDVFTYPVSVGVPSRRYYYENVAPRLKTVAAEERIDVNPIDPVEVEECLGGSTPYLS